MMRSVAKKRVGNFFIKQEKGEITGEYNKKSPYREGRFYKTIVCYYIALLDIAESSVIADDEDIASSP